MPIQIDLGSNTKQNNKPKPSGKIIGIDLGTTHSLVAWTKSTSESDIQVFSVTENESLLPSAVWVNSNTGKIEAIGKTALQKRSTSPLEVLTSVKRLMGRSYSDLKKVNTEIPFNLDSSKPEGQVYILVGEHKFNPVEISAAILKSLKAVAEKHLGEVVSRAVITVPAYFDDAQRSATKAAGRLAGLDVVRVLNEPTAASLSFGWSQENPGKLVVIDLGGGTLDVSVLSMDSKLVEVMATSGDTHLGGDDFDQALLSILGDCLDHLNSKDVQKSWQNIPLAERLAYAEIIKKELTDKTEIKNFSLGNFSFSLNKKTAETIWKPLIDRALECVERAMKDSGLNKEDLNDVLLVGGASRMPLFQAEIETYFGKKPNLSLHPDEAIVRGAAISAHQLESSSESSRLLLDVTPLSLGLETFGGTVSKLIPRNSALPTEAREVFTNHAEKQTAFDFHIVQGERELVADTRSLARFKLRGLPPAPPGFHRIEVVFRIDSSGILSVRAKDLRTGKFREIEVRPSFGISEEELLSLLEAAEKNADLDMASRQLADLRVEADSVIRASEKTIENVKHLAEPNELSGFRSRLVDLKNAVNSSSLEALREALSQLEDAGKDLAELQVNAALQKSLSGKDVSKV